MKRLTLVIGLIVALTCQVAIAQMTPERRKQRAEEFALYKKEAAEMSALQRTYVSLPSYVSRYCNLLLAKRPFLGFGYSRRITATNARL